MFNLTCYCYPGRSRDDRPDLIRGRHALVQPLVRPLGAAVIHGGEVEGAVAEQASEKGKYR